MSSRRVCGLLLAAAATAVAAAGCGDSSDSSAGAAAVPSTKAPPPPAHAKKPTGTPLKIGVMSPVGQPAGDVPQDFAGVRAAARAINARGGIKGHPIVVKTCNTLVDPNQEAACARNAVRDHALAMVGNNPLLNQAGVNDVLKEAGTANITPFMQTPQDFTNPINFPVAAPNFAMAACAALVPKVSGTKKVGVASIDLPVSISNATLAAKAATSHGAQSAGTVSFPLTTTDLGPVVQRVRKTGADMVILGMQPQIIAQFVSTATSQGSKWTYCLQDGTIYYKTLTDLGDAVGSFYTAAVYPPLQDAAKYPELQRFAAEMRAEEAAGDRDASLDPGNTPETALSPWVGMQVVEQVGKSMTGPINHTTFLKALNKAKVSFGNLLPPVDFSRPNPDRRYSRLINTRIFLKKWDTSAKRFRVVGSVRPVEGDKLAG